MFPEIVTYRPGRSAARVKLPILFCVSNHDTVTPPAQTMKYARTAPYGEIKTYDAGHFDFYLGEPFEALVRDQLEFLMRHLTPVPATTTAPKLRAGTRGPAGSLIAGTDSCSQSNRSPALIVKRPARHWS